MFGLNKKPVVDEEAKAKRAAARSAADKLRVQLKEKDVEIERIKDEAAAKERLNARSHAKKNEEIEELKERNNTLESLQNNRVQQHVTAVELEAKETMLAAKQKQYDNFEEELKKAKTEAETLGEERYKSGYSDGLADGLRKIHDITAEDRKQAMQVAALAASSHTPGAAETVAEGIRDGMMALPAGETAKTAKRKK